MRSPTLRCLVNQVTLSVMAWGKDASKARVMVLGPPGPPLPCSVQPGKSRMETIGEAQRKVTDYTVHFPTDPGAKIRDNLTWIDGGNKTLIVTGTRNPAGRSATFLVDAVEVLA